MTDAEARAILNSYGANEYFRLRFQSISGLEINNTRRYTHINTQPA